MLAGIASPILPGVRTSRAVMLSDWPLLMCARLYSAAMAIPCTDAVQFGDLSENLALLGIHIVHVVGVRTYTCPLSTVR